MDNLHLSDYLKFLQSELKWISNEYNRKVQMDQQLELNLNQSFSWLRGYAQSASILEKGLELSVIELINKLKENFNFQVYAQLNLGSSKPDFRLILVSYQFVERVLNELVSCAAYQDADLFMNQVGNALSVRIVGRKQPDKSEYNPMSDSAQFQKGLERLAKEIGANFYFENAQTETFFILD